MTNQFVLLLLASALLMGCRSLPSNDAPIRTPDPTPAITSSTASMGEEIALRALALVGKPYRYGGADLLGFDCSGLVYFIHQGVGIPVPRTAADQQRAAMSIARAALRPGDLLFFKTTSSTRISHVGVYVGESRFVHAPATGKLIEVRTLNDLYYGPRLVASGRLHPDS